MRGWGLLLVIALASAGSVGCGLLGSVPLLAERAREQLEECAERGRNRRWARQAFREVEAAAGGKLAHDYRAGFLDGFTELLYSGDPEPPPVPPARYRALCYQNLAGYRAIEQWFAGYRDGVAAAKDGGFRQFVIGPTAAAASTALPMVAPPKLAPKYVPSVVIRIDPFWLWRKWPCCHTVPQS